MPGRGAKKSSSPLGDGEQTGGTTPISAMPVSPLAEGGSANTAQPGTPASSQFQHSELTPAGAKDQRAELTPAGAKDQHTAVPPNTAASVVAPHQPSVTASAVSGRGQTEAIGRTESLQRPSSETTPLPPTKKGGANSASGLLAATTSSSAPPPPFEDRTDPGSNPLVDPGPLGALDVHIELPPPDSGSDVTRSPESPPEAASAAVATRPVLVRSARQKPAKPAALIAAPPPPAATHAPRPVPTVVLRSEPAAMSELTSPAIRALRPRGTVQVSIGTLLIGALSLILLVLVAVLLVR